MRSTKSAILAGSAAWNDTTGFVGSTSGTSYINLDFIPSTDGVNFTLDDACVCAYITTAATGDGDYIGGNGVSGSVTRINRTAGGVAHYGTVNAAVSSSAVNSSSLSLAGKLVCANRAGSGTNTTTTLYVDAVSQGTDTADASSLSAATIYACARNSNGSLTGAMNGTLGAVFFGAALTVQQQLDFNTIIEAYLA
jgi:hypothetical protein